MSSSTDVPSGTAVDVPRLPPGYLPRKRLLLLADADEDAHVLVVRAPAGGGKTALLVEWTERRTRVENVVWISLSSLTRTPSEFWTSLARALSSATQIHEGNDPDSIAAALNQPSLPPVCVVIDGFEALSPAVEGEVARFAMLLRRGRLVISTRRETLLESEIFSLQCHIATITAEQLNFTIEDVQELIHRLPRQGIPTDARALRAATNGHPLMTRLALSTEKAVCATQVSRLAADWVRTLLTLQQLEPALLLAQSPIVDVNLANQLTGSRSSKDLLGRLTQDGLGTTDDEGFFAFYELIGAALRSHAESTLDANSLQKARSTAASYLMGSTKHTAIAFQLLADAGRTAELWPFAIENYPALMSDPIFVPSVLDSLPSEVVAADGTLGAMRAILQSRRESAPSMYVLDTAAVALEELHARPRAQRPEEAFFRDAAILGLLRAVRRYDDAAAFADRLVKKINEFDPATRLRLRRPRHCVMLEVTETYALAGRLVDAESVLTSLEADGREHHSQHRHVQRAFIYAMRGEIAAASTIIDASLTHAPHTPAWAARSAITQAAIQLESGHADTARKTLKAIEPGLDVIEDWPYAVIVTARTHIATDPGAGLEDIRRLLQQHGQRPMSPAVRDLLDSAVADLALAAGEVRRAIKLVERRGERDFALRLTAARIALINNDHEAINDLRLLVEQEGVWPRLRAQALLLLAVHQRRAGLAEAAYDLIRRSLVITDEHQIRLIHALIPRSELETIAIEAGVTLPSNVNGTNPLEVFLSPVNLTERESALLEQLATNATLREIAANQFVTLHTIKSQTTSLYRKLDVRSRREAVEIARSKALLA